MPGCHLLLFPLVNTLHQQGFVDLSSVRRGQHLPLIIASWPYARYLGILVFLEVEWKNYRYSLCQADILWTPFPDALGWGRHLFDGRIFISKAYEHINSCIQSLPFAKLVVRLWGWEAPPKVLCFTWLTLHNRILTWDTLLKKGFIKPGRCSLYWAVVENCHHLFVL